jgi:hypothetical protein
MKDKEQRKAEIYAVQFNPCTYESCSGVLSIHLTRKEAEMALEFAKNEHIKEHGELSDWEVFSITEYKIT